MQQKTSSTNYHLNSPGVSSRFGWLPFNPKVYAGVSTIFTLFKSYAFGAGRSSGFDWFSFGRIVYAGLEFNLHFSGK